MTIPEFMKAVRLNGHGGFDQLEYAVDVLVPKPGAGEVLVRVGAAAINNTDIDMRTGWYSKSAGIAPASPAAGKEAQKAISSDASWSGNPINFPRIQGGDVCGRIVQVGEGVDTVRIDERVLINPCLNATDGTEPYSARFLGSEYDGGFAQYVKVESVSACKINSDLSDVELASFPCSYSAAENMLIRANVLAGERVLITGASGGAGSAAVQLAKRRGARVVAIAGASKAHKVMMLGADNVIPRGSSAVAALGKNSVDVVLDLVAGPEWPELLEVLKKGGRYVIAGAMAGPLVPLDLRTVYLKDLSLLGCTVPAPGVFSDLIQYIELGEIKPLVAEVYPLRDIVDAQEAFMAKKHTGKLVLVPPED